MSLNEPSAQRSLSPDHVEAGFLSRALHTGPLLLFGVRLWASVSLALFLSFWLQLDNPYWAGTSAAIVCQPSLGASLRKGWYRMVGTVIGATAAVVLTALFPQDRVAFLAGLALWAGMCACAGTLLRNFAAYAASLAGFTAAIIASDQLGATGGPNGAAFTLAISRATEICIGIVCAGVILAGTDFGNAPQRLAAEFANQAAEFTRNFVDTLAQAGAKFADTRTLRRELLRRVIALDPVIDEAVGETSQLRYHSPVLQAAVDGLFAAFAGWRAVALRLLNMPEDEARQEAHTVLTCVPQELQSVSEEGTEWIAAPTNAHSACEAAVRELLNLPAGTPSLQLLAAQTADVFGGIARALEGLALLTANAIQAEERGRVVDLRVPDWLPSLLNGGRAFVAISAVAIFWIVTAWPNGAGAITWTTIVASLFAPRADQAYSSALSFVVGSCFAAVFAAAAAFAVLPQLETFTGLSIVLGLYLVPVGMLMAQSWQKFLFTAMTFNFIPLLSPANVQVYDPAQFYNSAVALLVGTSVGVLSYRLLPPLTPAYRARRLLTLTLRDLRRIARKEGPRSPEDWQSRIYGRIVVMPDQATPQQRAEILVALSVGTWIIRLLRIGDELDLRGDIDAALQPLADGDSQAATQRLRQLDRAIAARHDATLAVVPARGLVLAISEAIAQHAAYFDGGEPG
jgi:uncharacterized membrane protein YccC